MAKGKPKQVRSAAPGTLKDHFDTGSTENRWPEDQLIRNAGFQIHSRSAGLPAMWVRGDIVIDHDEALVLAQEERDYAAGG